jgi:hypothetical protein
VAILPSGLLAIGCQDGKIRIWSPWQSKTVGTLDSGSQRGKARVPSTFCNVSGWLMLLYFLQMSSSSFSSQRLPF